MTSIPEFDLATVLGVGANSTVYRTVCSKDNVTYALKLIEVRGTEVTFEGIAKEVAFLKELDHPNIVKFVNAIKVERANEDNLTFGIQMEYCQKGNLDSFIRKRDGRKFRSQTMHKWMLELSSAVEYIHSKGIMHRNLKPGNIFLDKETNIKIGDFGFAKDVLNSSAGTTFGPNHFAAPETFTGCYYLEADIYSLGCVFLCMANVDPVPKTHNGRFKPLPANVTYGEKKTSLIRLCVSSDKGERPTALQIYQQLMSDDYETLRFSDARSSNVYFSINKMVAGLKPAAVETDVEPDESAGLQGGPAASDCLQESPAEAGLVFSSRPLKTGEKFSLLVQKIRREVPCEVVFGYLNRDPESFRGDVLDDVKELEKMPSVHVTKVRITPTVDKMFAFWFDGSGEFLYEYDGLVGKCGKNRDAWDETWFFFRMDGEVAQVQLTD